MTAGAPPKYRPEYPEIARKAYELGAVDEDIADMFEITIRTFYRWRATHKEFTAACEIGKAFADERVTASLYQRVCGYEYNAERVFMFSQWEKPLIVRYAKRVIGDPRMALHWLRVRQAAKWRIPKDDGGKGDLAEILAAALARVAEGRDPHGDD